MKFSNCFLLNALVYLTLASMTLQGKNGNLCSSTATAKATKIAKKSIAQNNPQEDIKTDLLFRF